MSKRKGEPRKRLTLNLVLAGYDLAVAAALTAATLLAAAFTATLATATLLATFLLTAALTTTSLLATLTALILFICHGATLLVFVPGLICFERT